MPIIKRFRLKVNQAGMEERLARERGDQDWSSIQTFMYFLHLWVGVRYISPGANGPVVFSAK